jgi:hypothetical protein
MEPENRRARVEPSDSERASRKVTILSIVKYPGDPGPACARKSDRRPVRATAPATTDGREGLEPLPAAPARESKRPGETNPRCGSSRSCHRPAIKVLATAQTERPARRWGPTVQPPQKAQAAFSLDGTGLALGGAPGPRSADHRRPDRPAPPASPSTKDLPPARPPTITRTARLTANPSPPKAALAVKWSPSPM